MQLAVYFKALADETRLRLFNLLLHHELNVNEIVSAMGMGQSRISRHLKILTDCGLLKYRRDGLWVFYSAERNGRGSALSGLITDCIDADADMRADYERLRKIIEEGNRRRERFFDSIASDWNDIRQTIFGGFNISDEIIARVKRCDVAADLGCGTGELLPYMKQKAKKVIGVDKSPRMLDEAGRRLSLDDREIELRIGEIEHLPMRDMEANTAVINMVLHHLSSPEKAITEAGRVLKHGGTLIIVDLEKHQNEQLRKKYEHRWLGFSRKTVERWLVDCGFGLEEFAQFDGQGGLKIDMYVSTKK